MVGGTGAVPSPWRGAKAYWRSGVTSPARCPVATCGALGVAMPPYIPIPRWCSAVGHGRPALRREMDWGRGGEISGTSVPVTGVPPFYVSAQYAIGGGGQYQYPGECLINAIRLFRVMRNETNQAMTQYLIVARILCRAPACWYI